MKKTLFFVMPLMFSGCSGLGTFVHDTVSLPGDQPTAPRGTSETFSKVLGKPVIESPILAEGGDIWPGAPDPMPSLQDVAQSTHSIAETLDDPDSYFGRMAAGRDEHDALFQEGAQMSIGEKDAVIHGVRRGKMDGSISGDISKPFIEKIHGTVVVPNGDDTVTLIAPDGSITVKKNATK